MVALSLGGPEEGNSFRTELEMRAPSLGWSVASGNNVERDAEERAVRFSAQLSESLRVHSLNPTTALKQACSL